MTTKTYQGLLSRSSTLSAGRAFFFDLLVDIKQEVAISLSVNRASFRTRTYFSGSGALSVNRFTPLSCANRTEENITTDPH